MTSVYISSTCRDLKEYRAAVAETLRRCDYNVDAMEKYPARDDRPKSACEADAAKCDLYVGIFAWRYGYVPPEDNPEGKSITELEYLAAGQANKPRLIFLLDDDFPWPSSQRDAEQEADGGKRVRDLRNRLRNERWTAFFKSPDDLAKQVLTPVIQNEATKQLASMGLLQDVQTAAEFGPSFLTNLQERFNELRSAEFIVLRLGPKPWWNTRLHLAAALASDFTEIRQFLILDADRRVVVVASPAEIRRALTKVEHKLEMAYLQARDQARPPFLTSEVDSVISAYPNAVAGVMGQTEIDFKQELAPMALRELGIRTEGEVLQQYAPHYHAFSYSEIMTKSERYVVLMRDGNIEGVIDRVELASRLAVGGV
jgi:hypothetical protein